MEEKTKKQIRNFYLGLSIILLIFGSYFLYKSNHAAKWFFILIFLLLIVYFAFPKIARSLYLGWMVFVRGLAWIQTRILLTIFFYLIICPTGLIMKLVRKDILNRKFEKNKKSYWLVRPERKFNKEEYLKQY